MYDDADYISRTLDGAEESFVELYHAMGQWLTRPLDSLAALQRLPAGVAALITSSPDYLERFRYMTRGEQVKALSKLTTQLLVTFGTVKVTSRTLTRTFSEVEATVPVLSLSAEGALVMERVAVSVGKVAMVLSSGPGGPSSFIKWVQGKAVARGELEGLTGRQVRTILTGAERVRGCLSIVSDHGTHRR